MSSTETLGYVEPTPATATVEPPPATNAQNGMPPVLGLRLPDECQPVRVGGRTVWTVPQFMEHEASEWNSVQFQIQELTERRLPVEPIDLPTEEGIDVMGTGTTRQQLQSIMAGEKYHIRKRDDLEHFRELGGLDKRLLRIIWESERIEFLRSIAAAGAAVDRANAARERQRREAPAELHDRLKALEEERRKATFEILDDGRSGANRVAYCRERISQAETLLSPSRGAIPNNRDAVEHDLREWRRELAEREAKLAKIDKETADIESQMLE